MNSEPAATTDLIGGSEQRGIGGKQSASAVRGPCAERLQVRVDLDPYLPLKGLAAYSGLSVRTLRDHLRHPEHPLPHYRPGGKVLIRRSEFDEWLRRFRRLGDPDLGFLVEELAADL